MGSVIDFNTHRQRRAKPAGNRTNAHSVHANLVTCQHCGENHPIVRLAGGEQRCVTAFFDGTHWFCRNRGCRRAWLTNRHDA
jgi:hypothetical protein